MDDERASARGGGSNADVGWIFWIFHGGERGSARVGGRVDDARGVVIGGCVLVRARGCGSCMGGMGNRPVVYEGCGRREIDSGPMCVMR